MVNCTYDDVRLIINTALTDANITSLIVLADQEITDRGFDTLDADTKKRMSMIFTAAMISLRDPDTRSIGEFSEKYLNAIGWNQVKADLIAAYSTTTDGGIVPSVGISGGLPFISVNEAIGSEGVETGSSGGGGGSGGGATAFTDLTDVPSSYSGEAGKYARVKTGENGLEFVTGTAGLTDHGALTGLGDDDHTQYLNNARHDLTARHTMGSVVPHDALANLTERSHANLTNVTTDQHHAKQHALNSSDDHTGTITSTQHGDQTAIPDSHHPSGNVKDYALGVKTGIKAGTNITITDVGGYANIASSGAGGVTDHGALTGLADDDHTQYLNNTRHDTTDRHTIGPVVPHDALNNLTEKSYISLTDKPTIVTDHGALTGLADDDHTQYLNTTRHDTTTRHALGTVVPHDALANLTEKAYSSLTGTPTVPTPSATVSSETTYGISPSAGTAATFSRGDHTHGSPSSGAGDTRGHTIIVAAYNSIDTTLAPAAYRCDGTADEVQINAAITALSTVGGTVQLLEGTYTIAAPITPTSNTTLQGQGYGTVIKLVSAHNATINLIYLNGVTNVAIRDLKIDGNKAGQSTAGENNNIKLEGSTYCRVERCDIENSYTHLNNGDGDGHGVLTDDSTDCTFVGNVTKNNFHGFQLGSGGLRCVVANNICHDTDVGIELYNCSYCSVTGNVCQGDNGAWNGITLSTVLHSSVTGNVCRDNSHMGIKVAYSSCYNTIAGNACYNNSNAGIYLEENTDHNTFTGNNCSGNLEYGIAIETQSVGTSCRWNTFSGNTVAYNSMHGIVFWGAEGNLISGNVVVGNSQILDNYYANIALGTDNDSSIYNSVQGNVLRAPSVSTTLTQQETAGATTLHVASSAGFMVGAGVVIDLGGGLVEYHRILSVSTGIITISPGLTHTQVNGETVDLPRPKTGILIATSGETGNLVTGNDLYHSAKSYDWDDGGTSTVYKSNRTSAGWVA